MRTSKNGFRRITAMVCALALCASMLPTAVFAVESEATTPTPEPTPIVETTPEPSGSPENTDATVTTPVPGTDADSTAAPSEEPTVSPDGSPAPSEEPVESPEPSEVPAEQEQPAPQMLAAAPAPVANEPETRSGPAATDSEKGNEYITVYYNDCITVVDAKTLTVKVQNENGEPLCGDLVIDDITTSTTARVTLDQSKYADYKIQSYELSGGGSITDIPGSLNNDQNKTFMLHMITDDSVLVVTLQKIQSQVIDLTDSKASGRSFGSIIYKEDENVSQTTNVHIYLNNEFVKTVKDLKLPSDIAGVGAGNDDSFVLTLEDGYYFAPYVSGVTPNVCTGSTVSSAQEITWNKDTRNGLYSFLTYTYPNGEGTNDITLNFFTYEEGVRADFTRYVNGDTVYASGGGVSAACEKLHINYTYNGTEYNMVYDTWGLAQTIFLPRGTYIYVEPVIKDGFSFVYWLSEDSWTKGNSLYSVLPDGSLKQEETGLGDEQKGLVALTQTMALYYDADGYTRAQIGLHMTDGRRPGMYNEVYYHSNYPVEAGKVNETEISYYYPTLDYGTRIENCMFSVDGYTFAGWNTQEDGEGTSYTAGQYFHDDLGNNLILYAQWKKIDTPPVETSVALKKTILSVKRGDGTLTGNNIPATLKVGDEITYQINVTNTGDVKLEGLTVTDAFTGNNKPSEGDGITWSGAAGNWTGTISNIELPAGEAKTYKYTCTVAEEDKGKTISNKATINGDDSKEPIDEDEIKTVVENPAVGVEKSLVQVKRGEEIFLAEKGTIPEELEVGDELTYEIEVKNIGNVKLKGLTLTDTFNGHFAPSKVKDKVANVELTNEWEKDTTTGLWTLKIENISPDVGEIETYTYTYTVNQADAGNTLTNTAVVTGDELDRENPPEDKDEHKVTNDGDITLQPADITIYMGGKDGYAGAAGGDSNSLPEPGFYITLPGEVEKALQDAGYPNGEAADLSKIITGVTATTADGQTRSWTMKKYGATQSTAWIDDTSQAHFVYRIVPNQGQDPISVNFTDGDGKSVTEDKFTLTDSLSETYFMSLNTAGVDVETISLTFNIKDQIFHCGYDAKNSQKGTLTVRYTTTPDAPTTPAAQSGEDLQANIEANPDSYYVQVAGSDQKFYINEQDTGVDGVDVTAKDVSLLADNIVSDQANAEAASAMVQKAFEAANFGESTAWSKYLDLVDAENGNAWLTPEDGTEVTVFWPYPEGVTKDSEIKLYHFEGLDRDMATGEQLLAQVALTEAKLVPIIEKYEDGFTFNTSSFSPFVLVQNTTQPSGGEDKPSGDDDGNNDNNNNNTNTNNQTTTVNVANQAAAPAAAPAAVSVPQTSDNSQPLVWVALVVVSGAALAALAVFRRKRSDK